MRQNHHRKKSPWGWSLAAATLNNSNGRFAHNNQDPFIAKDESVRTDSPNWSPNDEPTRSSPPLVPIHAKTRTWPALVPPASFPKAPAARMVPSSEGAMEVRNTSRAASPSMVGPVLVDHYRLKYHNSLSIDGTPDTLHKGSEKTNCPPQCKDIDTRTIKLQIS